MVNVKIVNRSGTDNVIRVEEDLATIGDLKAYVEETAKILCNDQIIVHSNTLITDNGTKLKDLLGSELQGELQVYQKIPTQEMRINVVTETGRDLEVDIESGETVLTLKKAIDEWRGVSPHRQRLTIMGAAMRDEDALNEYIATDVPVVYLNEVLRNQEKLMRINMEVNGVLTDMSVEKSDTIYTLHGLARQAHVAKGRRFYFRWNGARLSGSLTFEEYGITAGSTLNLVKVAVNDGADSYDGDDDSEGNNEDQERDD